MNYYPFHLGDYAAHTGHLEPMEDLVYRRLLDLYYLREGPLPTDVMATAKLIRARSMAADVESVLQEFFVLTEDGWRHTRCDEEIAKMQDKQSKARASAAASVNARRAKAERSPPPDQTDAERSLNSKVTDVQLPTPTPTPTPEEKNPSGSVAASKSPRKPTGSKRVPADFTVLPDMEAWATENAPLVDWRRETEKFRDWEFKTARTDWAATWRTWMRKAQESAAERGVTARGPVPDFLAGAI